MIESAHPLRQVPTYDFQIPNAQPVTVVAQYIEAFPTKLVVLTRAPCLMMFADKKRFEGLIRLSPPIISSGIGDDAYKILTDCQRGCINLVHLSPMVQITLPSN